MREQLRRTLQFCLLCGTCALVLPACGGKAMKAETTYAEGHDFAQYQSYRWLTDDLVLIQSGTGNERIRNVENEKRIRAAVERELEAKGLRKVEGDGEEAGLVIAFTVGTQVRYKLQGGGGMTFDMVTSEAASVTRGTLSLYLFDAASSAQVWEAHTTKDLEPGEDPDPVINAAVAVLMAEYPPQ